VFISQKPKPAHEVFQEVKELLTEGIVEEPPEEQQNPMFEEHQASEGDKGAFHPNNNEDLDEISIEDQKP